jgi:hypothetical protein
MEALLLWPARALTKRPFAFAVAMAEDGIGAITRVCFKK